MKRRKRSIKFLILSLPFFILLTSLIYFLPPNYQLHIINFKLSVMNLFLLPLFIFLFLITTFFSKSTKHGILLGLFATSFLTFRLNNLTHPFFFLLLSALFLVLELLFAYRK